tara:strand:- start:1290 stop:1652 length:363 start_codon:yes stop_codon:yes gene_type:complete
MSNLFNNTYNNNYTLQNKKFINDFIITINKYKFFYKHFFIGFSISFILWILYLEINPKLGNIWLRENSESNIVFAPINIINMIFYSCNNITFWYPWNWDMNPFIWIIIGTSGYLIYRYYI